MYIYKSIYIYIYTCTHVLNPLFFVSVNRLSIRNLAKTVTDSELKTLCINALKVGLAKNLVTNRYTYIYFCFYLCIYIYKYIHICICLYTYIYIHVLFTFTYICMYMYTYIYIYIYNLAKNLVTNRYT
jgi:hypothetical protein